MTSFPARRERPFCDLRVMLQTTQTSLATSFCVLEGSINTNVRHSLLTRWRYRSAHKGRQIHCSHLVELLFIALLRFGSLTMNSYNRGIGHAVIYQSRLLCCFVRTFLACSSKGTLFICCAKIKHTCKHCNFL